MKAALGQIDTRQADPEGNGRRILVACRRARALGAELAIFPELALPGYAPGDWLLREDFLGRCADAEAALAAELPEGLTVIVGGVTRRQTGLGKPLENAAVVLERGRVRDRVGKRLLPTYDVFDERRWFEPAASSRVLELGGRRLGLTVCEDVWVDQPVDVEVPRYAVSPPDDLVRGGAGVLINLSASPYSRGRPAQREAMMRALAARLGRPFLSVNLVGGNDDLVFDGHSVAIDARGDVVARARGFAEDLVIVDVDAPGGLAPLAPVGRRDDAALDELAAGLILGLRDYVLKSGFSRVVLGLSGGVDSALVALLAAEALGAANVHAVAMPSRYNAAMSAEDAAALARGLGLRFETLPIEAVRAAIGAELEPVLGAAPRGLTLENVQPRIRGLFLMALSNERDALLLATGNKSEIAVGYCTLYGDMCGALAPIADVDKTTVYALIRRLDARLGGVVPPRIVDREPSAELAAGQRDRDTLPDYAVLDAILAMAVEEGRGRDEIVAAGHDPATVDDVLARVARAEYKRRQMPPGLRVTRKAFGSGRRMPLAAGGPGASAFDAADRPGFLADGSRDEEKA